MEAKTTIIKRSYPPITTVIRRSYAPVVSVIRKAYEPLITVIITGKVADGGMVAVAIGGSNGYATLSADTLMRAVAAASSTGTAQAIGEGLMVVTSVASSNGSVKLVAEALMSADALASSTGSAVLSAAASGEMTANASATATAIATLIANGLMQPASTAGSTSIASLIAEGLMVATGTATATGAASLVAYGLLSGSASASSTGNATLTADSGGSSSYDANAQSVITAIEGTGVTLTTTEKGKIDRLFRDLKGQTNSSYATYDILTKFKALYGIKGGTEAAHKFNWIDPRDADDAYRLTFPNGATHDANGIDWNGTNQYANTHLSPSSVLDINSSHISYYMRDNYAAAEAEMGAYQGSNAQLYINTKYSDNKTYWAFYGGDVTIAANTIGNTAGLFTLSKTSSSLTNLFYNGNSMASATIGTTGMPSIPIFIGSFNLNGTPSGYSTRQFAFASIGDGLSDSEAVAFYNAVQAYLTT